MLKEIKKKYKWIFETNKEIITHTDIDGLLSALYMRNKSNWKIKGYYNLYDIYSKDDKNNDMGKYIYLDLDVNEDLKNIGHHFSLIKNSVGFNINNVFGIKRRDKYTRKCPLPTILILCWLMEDKEILKDIKKLSWIVYADSFIVSWRKHKNNCINWLNKLKLNEVIQELEKNDIEHHIDNIIENEVIPIIKIYKDTWNVDSIDFNEYNLNQCFFNIKKNKDRDLFHIQGFTEFFEMTRKINKIFDFKYIYKNDLSLYKMNKIKTLYNYKINYTKEIYHDLVSRKIISNAIVFCNNKQIIVSVSLDSPMSKEDDLHKYII